ncbi:hypothetical protein Tco_0858843 [Tanacetum coccineum]|uniref:Uncharacterized protein n=1 Tax=Tanacetum coccineum TaxID=301880 RepID=A0ABQ5BB32_9ASTR
MEFSDIVNRLEKHSFVDGNRSDSSLLELSPASINHLFGSCSSLDPSSLCGASRLKTMQDAIEMATELMDKKISTLAERQAENKRKLDNNNQAQQQSPKRQNVAQAYAAGTGERKEYVDNFSLFKQVQAAPQWAMYCKVRELQEGTTGRLTQKLKNQNYENKLKVLEHVEWCMPLEEEKPNKTFNNIEDEIEA